MAADTPLTLAAASVADDLGYVALAAIASAFEANTSGSYRVIGGHMVTALVAPSSGADWSDHERSIEARRCNDFERRRRPQRGDGGEHRRRR